MKRRLITSLTALLVPLALAGPAGARVHPDTGPAGTVQITPTSGGTTRDTVGVVTGSSIALVYSQQPDNRSAGNPDYDRFMALTSGGTTTDLGPATAQYASSVVGTTFTAAPGRSLHTVDWYSLSGTSSGTVDLPGGATYQTGAPGGFVYARDGELYRRTTGGAIFDLGRPYGRTAALSSVAFGSGLVVTSGSRAAYLVFGHPNRFHALDTGGHTLICTAIAGSFTACRDQVYTPVLVPLDGRSPRVMSGSHSATLMLSGSTMIVNDGNYLRSIEYSSPDQRVSTARYANPGVSAFGAAVVQPDTASPSSAVSVTSATAAPSTVLTAPFGPPTTASMSLSPGQLVYDDDRAEPGVPPAAGSTFRTPVSTSAARLSLGATSTVQQADAGYAMASGTTTVYASSSVFDSGTGSFVQTLVVRGPLGPHMITGVTQYVQDADPSLSGNRLLYETGSLGAPAYHVYDLASNKTLDPQGDGPAIAGSPVIDGDVLAYSAADGGIEYEDLRTGHTVQVSAPPANDCGPGVVYLAADHVGWSNSIEDPSQGLCETGEAGYRDVATMGPPTLIDTGLEGMSDSGAIVLQFHEGYVDTVLQRYDGTDVTLVSHASPATSILAGPVVSGRTEAWINKYGQLLAAPLPITPSAPRFEGDPVLLPESSTSAVHAFAPYSEPLTSCSVAITNSAAATIATLPCVAADERIGVADFDWDGQSDGSPAPPGTYTFTITAAGDGGSAQDADGTTGPVTGTFTVEK